MPVMELEALISEEISQNPMIEWDVETLSSEIPSKSTGGKEEDDLKAYIENSVSYETSLYDHLMNQAKMTFGEEEYKLATLIIGHIDESGFLTTPLEEIALLSDVEVEVFAPLLEMIQTFDPIGVGARSLQESLLIQLKLGGKESSLAYRIVDCGYDDMLKNRIPSIAKVLHRSSKEIYDTIAGEIAPLDFHPGTLFSAGHYKRQTHHLIPDLHIDLVEGALRIEINDSSLPSFRFNNGYLKMLESKDLDSETRTYIQEKLTSGKWLVRNLQERHQTLRRIAEKIVETQSPYLSDPKGDLKPMTMKEIAEMLELHESTIARAVANKYLSCPRGILPLRSFFTNAYTTDSGKEISSKTVKECLKQIISKEDRTSPLSDEAISKMIKSQGIACARRTVAKYRSELGIGNTTQRKIHA
ncbi:MAG: RNA polymerase sigma-54 factor [Chlamydiales bacterium]|nr:RNA polymerase sigma-54 factor [Chlamydiales bacterium]MCH9619560.1 RNA polymerase sigma-54 factor [Chlamydiales bacterium]MCH9623166.1 RNA polymerase sigma-54 factor [Chlamydiales bacterium]